MIMHMALLDFKAECVTMTCLSPTHSLFPREATHVSSSFAPSFEHILMLTPFFNNIFYFV